MVSIVLSFIKATPYTNTRFYRPGEIDGNAFIMPGRYVLICNHYKFEIPATYGQVWIVGPWNGLKGRTLWKSAQRS